MNEVPEGQMTLEDLYCVQHIKPMVEKLALDANSFKENPPKNLQDLQAIVNKLHSYLNIFAKQVEEFNDIARILQNQQGRDRQ